MNSASQSTSPPVRSVDEARSLLGELEGLNRRSRLLMSATWFPLLIGGIVTLVGIPAAQLLEDTGGEGLYWAFGGPFIFLSCAAFYGTRRIQVPDRLAVLVTVAGLATIAGAFAASNTDPPWQTAGPLLAGAVGLGVIAFAYRSATVAAVSAVHLATTVALVLAEPEEPFVGTLVVGAAACLFGIVGVLQTLSALEAPLVDSERS